MISICCIHRNLLAIATGRKTGCEKPQYSQTSTRGSNIFQRSHTVIQQRSWIAVQEHGFGGFLMVNPHGFNWGHDIWYAKVVFPVWPMWPWERSGRDPVSVRCNSRFADFMVTWDSVYDVWSHYTICIYFMYISIYVFKYVFMYFFIYICYLLFIYKSILQYITI